LPQTASGAATSLLQDKWCYLALVVDLYSRRIIGSALSLTADVVCRAMCNVLENRLRGGCLLFHSAQGVQSKSNKYRKLFWHYGVMQSMSRRGNGLDNSPMERVFRSLKSEWIPKGDYSDFSHAVRDINQWVNGYHNIYQPHTSNGGLSPCLA
jgi:putative transposase